MSQPEPVKPSPCRTHACDACCRETTMSLTRADVERLTAAGEEGFAVAHADGTLRLATRRDGSCGFLVDGRCRVYAHRPEGCVLYPQVWFIQEREVGLDPFCPYRREFRFSAGDREWLERSIATEEIEVAERLAGAGDTGG